MKAFIIKIALISLAILILFSAANTAYINSDYFKSSFINWERFEDLPQEIDIVNTGSSHAASGINYSVLDGFNCRQFSAAGQTLEYDLKLLKQYSGNLKRGGIVIIPINHLSFTRLDEEMQLKHSLRYYRILEPGFIEGFNLSDYMLYKVFPILTSDNELFDAMKKKPINTTSRTMADYTQTQIANAIARNKASYFDQYEYDPKCLDTLCEIIEFAYELDMRPVMVTIPVSDAYGQLSNETMINNFNKALEYVIEKYGVEYYGYAQDTDIASNYELFKNTNHLNKQGSLVFSEKLFMDLGLLPGK